jgi:hypothetical protein
MGESRVDSSHTVHYIQIIGLGFLAFLYFRKCHILVISTQLKRCAK